MRPLSGLLLVLSPGLLLVLAFDPESANCVIDQECPNYPYQVCGAVAPGSEKDNLHVVDETSTPSSSFSGGSSTTAALLPKICVHKPLLAPPIDRDVGLGIAFLLLSGLALSAGVGGGGIYVPLLILVAKFAPHKATAVSQSMLAGGATSVLLYNFSEQHPVETHKPMVDVDLVIILGLPLMAGVQAGTWIHKVSPDWLMLCLLVLVLGYSGKKTLEKGLKMWKAENANRQGDAGKRNARKFERMRRKISRRVSAKLGRAENQIKDRDLYQAVARNNKARGSNISYSSSVIGKPVNMAHVHESKEDIVSSPSLKSATTRASTATRESTSLFVASTPEREDHDHQGGMVDPDRDSVVVGDESSPPRKVSELLQPSPSPPPHQRARASSAPSPPKNSPPREESSWDEETVPRMDDVPLTNSPLHAEEVAEVRIHNTAPASAAAAPTRTSIPPALSGGTDPSSTSSRSSSDYSSERQSSLSPVDALRGPENFVVLSFPPGDVGPADQQLQQEPPPYHISLMILDREHRRRLLFLMGIWMLMLGVSAVKSRYTPCQFPYWGVVLSATALLLTLGVKHTWRMTKQYKRRAGGLAGCLGGNVLALESGVGCPRGECFFRSWGMCCWSSRGSSQRGNVGFGNRYSSGFELGPTILGSCRDFGGLGLGQSHFNRRCTLFGLACVAMLFNVHVLM